MKTLLQIIEVLENELILLENDKSNNYEKEIEELKKNLKLIRYPIKETFINSLTIVKILSKFDKNVVKEFKEYFEIIRDTKPFIFKKNKNSKKEIKTIIQSKIKPTKINKILKVAYTTLVDWKKADDYKKTLYFLITSFSEEEINERLKIKIEFNISDTRRINENIKIPIRTLNKWKKENHKRFPLYTFINSFSEEELKNNIKSNRL